MPQKWSDWRLNRKYPRSSHGTCFHTTQQQTASAPGFGETTTKALMSNYKHVVQKCKMWQSVWGERRKSSEIRLHDSNAANFLFFLSFFLSGDFNCCPFSLLLLSFMWYLLLFCLALSRHSLFIFCYWSISVIPYAYFPSCNDLKCYSYNISVFLIPGEDYVQNMPWHSFFPLKPYPHVDCGTWVPSINLQALPLTSTLPILRTSAATRGHCFGLLESPMLIQVISYSIFKPWIHIIHCQSLSKYQI